MCSRTATGGWFSQAPTSATSPDRHGGAARGDPPRVGGRQRCSYLCVRQPLFPRAPRTGRRSGPSPAPTGGGPARDGSMAFDRARGKAPLLTIFGGDITTSGRAEPQSHSSPHSIRCRRAGPPQRAAGRRLRLERFDAEVDAPWPLAVPLRAAARRLVAAYGSRLSAARAP
jgi:hypothetical protein